MTPTKLEPIRLFSDSVHHIIYFQSSAQHTLGPGILGNKRLLLLLRTCESGLLRPRDDVLS